MTSCKKSELDVIPDIYVDFTIDLNDPLFFELSAPGNSVLVDASTNNWGIRAGGYDGNGIIIYNSQPGEYFAFDRTCPYDFASTGNSVAVEVEPGSIYAICPVCNSKYLLPGFGTPSDGPSTYPLKNYKTDFTFGRYIRVYN